MKIASSQIDLAAAHQFNSRIQVQESLHISIGAHGEDAGNVAPGAQGTQVSLSDAGRRAAQSDGVEQAPAETVGPDDDLLSIDPQMRIVKLLVEMLTGAPIKLTNPATFKAPANADAVPVQRAADNVGMVYQRRETFEETETTAFSASGVIRTADGKEIRFNLSLVMARSYRETREETMLFGAAAQHNVKDPLVLNFDGAASQLHSVRVPFDLDGDGILEEVPLLRGDRGYLALDLNNNGQIDSGKELFGPISGNGFADLAQYDADGNGWIDENDPVFDALRVWMQDADGGTLATLKEKGVGAIFLGRSDTPFALNDAANNGLGIVRSSGLYLSEDGRVGTVQQIDLIV